MMDLCCTRRSPLPKLLVLFMLIMLTQPQMVLADTEIKPEVRVEGRAVPATDGVFTVLWKLTPTLPWYLYSDRLNDSGFPPGLTASWPEGWQAGPLQWPVAERHLLENMVLDHVYHGPVTLLQEVRPVAGAFAAGPVEVKTRWSWLACHEMCVPGHSSATVVFSPEEPEGVADVMAARANLPRPLPEDRVTVRWGDGTVHFIAPDASALEFHPAGDGQGVRFQDLPADGAVQGQELTLHLRPGPDGFGALRGTLLINHDDGSAEFWTVDIPYGGR